MISDDEIKRLTAKAILPIPDLRPALIPILEKNWDGLNAIFKQQESISALLSKTIPSILASVESTTKLLESIYPAIASVMNGVGYDLMARIGAGEISSQKDFDKCHPRLVSHGWLILYWVPFYTIREINAIEENRLEKELEELFFSLIDDQNFYFLNMLLSESSKSKSQRRNSHVIKTVVDLYKKSGIRGVRNYHNVVVPSLIPIIDSASTRLARLKFRKEKEYMHLIAAEKLMIKSDKKKVSLKGKKVDYHDVLQADKKRRAELTAKANNDGYWLGAGELLAKLFNDDLLGGQGLNRNGILHGRNSTYGTRANSARLLLLLGFLLELEDELDSI